MSKKEYRKRIKKHARKSFLKDVESGYKQSYHFYLGEYVLMTWFFEDLKGWSHPDSFPF